MRKKSSVNFGSAQTFLNILTRKEKNWFRRWTDGVNSQQWDTRWMGRTEISTLRVKVFTFVWRTQKNRAEHYSRSLDDDQFKPILNCDPIKHRVIHRSIQIKSIDSYYSINYFGDFSEELKKSIFINCEMLKLPDYFLFHLCNQLFGEKSNDFWSTKSNGISDPRDRQHHT